MALRGLSSPVTSRSGNRFGMIGMAVAIVASGNYVGGTIWPGPGKAGGIPSGLGVGNGGGKGGAFWSGTALGATLGLGAGDGSPLGGAGDGLD